MPPVWFLVLGDIMYTPWTLAELDTIKNNGLTAFSFFSCGGGSCMGYKRAGYNLIGNCEIDTKIANMYEKNLHPQYSYNMDIRDFLKIPNTELPAELFKLDILDGSPPCSAFSMSGQRENVWGKKKKFREGQTEQILDDLFLEFIKAVEKLKPKTFVAENVKGILNGNAKGYVAEILKGFHDVGYAVQIFCLNSAYMGVPQRRERVFFIGHKKELKYSKLKLQFKEELIPFREIRDKGGREPTQFTKELLKLKKPTDRKLSDVNKRLYGETRASCFNHSFIWDNVVAPTITAGGEFYKMHNDKGMSDNDFINCQTFPIDYNFDTQKVQYVCGMSVPPIMMEKIAKQIHIQWLK